MDGTSDAHTGWEHIPPALAAVARRSGITAAELDAFRDDPANQDTGLPEFDDADWDRILAPAPDDLPERAAVDRSPRVHPPATEPITEPDAHDRQVALARLDTLGVRTATDAEAPAPADAAIAARAATAAGVAAAGHRRGGGCPPADASSGVSAPRAEPPSHPRPSHPAIARAVRPLRVLLGPATAYPGCGTPVVLALVTGAARPTRVIGIHRPLSALTATPARAPPSLS